MNESHNRVSVALCTYNGERYLREQLDSILNQTLPANEIVIIDDNSSDNTVEIIKQYSRRFNNIKFFINEKNLGYVRNFSLAISKTSGDFVALADQDDIWTNDHLEVLLRNIGNKAVCVGDASMMDSEGKEIGKTFSQIKRNFYIPKNDVDKAYRIVYNYSPYQGASMLIDRKWVENFLPIPDGAGYQDTFLSGCASLTNGLSVIPDIVNKYRIHEGQVTKEWGKTVFDEIKHRRHHICFSSKNVLIDRVAEDSPNLSRDAISFINEFYHIMDLDKRNKRMEILRIKNKHYKEIYSCHSYKYIFLRSIHFLLSL